MLKFPLYPKGWKYFKARTSVNKFLDILHSLPYREMPVNLIPELRLTVKNNQLFSSFIEEIILCPQVGIAC
jgi:hypothetical protein